MSELFGRSEQGASGMLWTVYEGENEDFAKARLVASFSKREEAWEYTQLKTKLAAAQGELAAAQAENKRLKTALEKIMLDEVCCGDCRLDTCPAGVAQVALGYDIREAKTPYPECDEYCRQKRIGELEGYIRRIHANYSTTLNSNLGCAIKDAFESVEGGK